MADRFDEYATGDTDSEMEGSSQFEDSIEQPMETNVKSRLDPDSYQSASYEMSRLPRGRCLILNNFEFTDVEDRRDGAKNEAIMFRSLFSDLGFDVQLVENLTTEEIDTFLYRTSRDPSLKYHDALIVFIMSHGHKGYILGTDNRQYRINDILEHFSNGNCPALLNKPKIFFVEACRGENYNFVGSSRAQADSIGEGGDVFYPTGSHPSSCTDMAVVFATTKGHLALRDPTSGSWFGEALAVALSHHPTDYDLQELLAMTNHLLRQRNGDSLPHHQVMEWRYIGWTKRFYFKKSN